jgi:hypothetical protein
MVSRRRLEDLEEILDSSYETLGTLEKKLAYASSASEINNINQTISREILPRIRKSENEYLQLLAAEANSFVIDENDADIAIVEFLQTIEQIQQSSIERNSNQVIQLLIEIRDKLNEPDKSAAAKLKATLPLLPPFVSYEVELGTENILQRMFPTFRRILKKK